MPNRTKKPNDKKQTYASKAADNIISIAKGNGFTTKSRQVLKFVAPKMSDTIIDAVLGGTDEKELRAVVISKFSAANKHLPIKEIQSGLRGDKNQLSRRLKTIRNEQRKADIDELIISAEHPVKVNRVVRATGWCLLALGGALVVSVPLITAMTIEESGLIDLVSENWLFGLSYGLAPLAGGVAAHNLRENILGEAAKRRFDMLINIGAVASFGAWAYIAPSTFLVDLTQGYGETEQFSRVDFYRAHFATELFGAAAVFTAATNKLTHGAKKVTSESDQGTKLEKSASTISKQIGEIDERLMTLTDEDQRFEQEQIAYAGEQISRWRAVKNAVTELKADSEAVSRADVTRILMKLDKESEDE